VMNFLKVSKKSEVLLSRRTTTEGREEVKPLLRNPESLKNEFFPAKIS